MYDERLTWEGMQDKMSQVSITFFYETCRFDCDFLFQMHELCLKKYNFVILDRAFVVHSPGIKNNTKMASSSESFRKPFIQENMKTYNIIMAELQKKYGNNPKCRKH